MYDSQGNIDGIHIDIVYALEDKLGKNIPRNLYPYDRIIRTLNEDEDSWTIMAVNPGIERSAHQLLIIHQLEVDFWAKPGLDLQNMNNLYGRSVARVQGTNLFPQFLSDRRIDVMDVVDTEMQMMMIATGRADALIATRAALGFAFQFLDSPLQDQLRDVNILEARVVDVAAYVPKARATHQDSFRLQGALSDLRENGDIGRFFNKYNRHSM